MQPPMPSKPISLNTTVNSFTETQTPEQRQQIMDGLLAVIRNPVYVVTPETFYRVPGQKAHGSGLGLSIAREIILAHTGTIGCRSEPSKQTTFYFTLPPATRSEEVLPARTDQEPV